VLDVISASTARSRVAYSIIQQDSAAGVRLSPSAGSVGQSARLSSIFLGDWTWSFSARRATLLHYLDVRRQSTQTDALSVTVCMTRPLDDGIFHTFPSHHAD